MLEYKMDSNVRIIKVFLYKDMENMYFLNLEPEGAGVQTEILETNVVWWGIHIDNRAAECRV